MEETMKILEMVLLLNEKVSKGDLLFKHKFSVSEINKAEKVLNYINSLN
jgi:hypothetical protein